VKTSPPLPFKQGGNATQLFILERRSGYYCIFALHVWTAHAKTGAGNFSNNYTLKCVETILIGAMAWIANHECPTARSLKTQKCRPKGIRQARW